MNYAQLYCRIFSAITIIVAGCETSQSPIELSDPSVRDQDLQVISDLISSETYLAVDSKDYTDATPASFGSSVPQGRFLGYMIVAGGVYDDSTKHYEASLARAVFFDKSKPLISNGDTSGFEALDAGVIRLDTIRLVRLGAYFVRGAGMSDTSLGVQYSFVDRGSPANSALRFVGGHPYRWSAEGSDHLSPFDATIIAPTNLHVVSPKPLDLVSASQNLLVRWEGGGTSVKILISDIEHSPTPRVIFQFRVSQNRGSVVIPSTILTLLPKQTQKFLFTFLSETNVVTRVNNYPEDVLMRAVTIHNLLLQVSQ